LDPFFRILFWPVPENFPRLQRIYHRQLLTWKQEFQKEWR